MTTALLLLLDMQCWEPVVYHLNPPELSKKGDTVQDHKSDECFCIAK